MTSINRAFGSRAPLIGKTHRGKRSEQHDYDHVMNIVRGFGERLDRMQQQLDRIDALDRRVGTNSEDIDKSFGILAARHNDIEDLQNELGNVKARIATLERPKRKPKNA